MNQIHDELMIDAPVVTASDTLKKVYNVLSRFYGFTAAPLERKPRLRGLELVSIQPQDKVLEAAVGPGATMLEILKRVDRTNIVYGVDFSSGMLEKTRYTVMKAGFFNVDLRQSDARSLPFEDNTFDVLYNSFMLDLIPLADMPVVLSEFRRVLKNGGRLALVNLSKDKGFSLSEKLYQATPDRLIPYFFGGCRPVIMEAPVRAAGFRDVQREYVKNHVIPSEVVVARK